MALLEDFDTVHVLRSAVTHGVAAIVEPLTCCVLLEHGRDRLNQVLNELVPLACAAGSPQTLRLLLSALPPGNQAIVNWVVRAMTSARQHDMVLVALEFEPAEADLLWAACRALESQDDLMSCLLLSLAAGSN